MQPQATPPAAPADHAFSRVLGPSEYWVGKLLGKGNFK